MKVILRVYCIDLEQSRSFYCDLLGFTIEYGDQKRTSFSFLSKIAS